MSNGMLGGKVCFCRNIDCRHQIIFSIRFQISNMLSWWASQASSHSTTHPTIFHEYFKSIYWIHTKTLISKTTKGLFSASMLRLLDCVTEMKISLSIISILMIIRTVWFNIMILVKDNCLFSINLPFAFFQSPDMVFWYCGHNV